MLADCRSLIFFYICLWFSFGQDEWFPSEENCGRALSRTVQDRSGVFPSPLGSSPWHASIYRLPPGPSAKMILVCSGTIITKSHILTAASCLFVKGCTKVNPDPFRVKVALERLSNDLSPDVQQREVKHARVDNYTGEIFGYVYNVAILFLNESLRLNDYVMPICIDWTGKTPIKPEVLEASGWGFNSNGGGSGALMNGVFSTEISSKCKKKDPNLRKYLSHDKFCLSTPQGRQQEDTGVGLVYRLGNRYYLKGVLSVLTNQAYSPVTNATKFVQWFEYAVKRLDQEKKCEGRFPCATGTCIDVDQVCNRVPNCPDGSDEPDNICLEGCVGIVKLGTPPPVIETHCVLPVQLGGSTYHLLNCEKDCEKPAGTPVDFGSPIELTCGEGTLPLNQNPVYVCTDRTHQQGMASFRKEWYPHAPLCQKSCRIQEKRNVVPFHCEMHKNRVECDTYLRPGTSVSYSCSERYEFKKDSFGALIFNPNVTCMENGEWSDQPPQCIPKCGVKNSANLNEPTIAHGKPAKVGEFPWQIALYSRENETQPWEQICGGTILLYPHIVLTAAHCLFWDVKYANNLKKPSQTRVAAGKILRNLTHSEQYQQEASVRQLIPHEEYVANRNDASLKNDIALLILEKPFTLTDVVLPSCINYYNTANFLSVSKGKVAGWGYTEKNLHDFGSLGVPSDVLLYTDIYLSNNQNCKSLAGGNEQIVTSDKFCGLYNKGSGPLKGDSGGGLVIFNPARKVYDVIGVVSTKPTDSNAFGTFTSIGSHKDWLQAKIKANEDHILFFS